MLCPEQPLQSAKLYPESDFSQWLGPVGGNKQILCRARGRDVDPKPRPAYEISSA